MYDRVSCANLPVVGGLSPRATKLGQDILVRTYVRTSEYLSDDPVCLYDLISLFAPLPIFAPNDFTKKKEKCYHQPAGISTFPILDREREREENVAW